MSSVNASSGSPKRLAGVGQGDQHRIGVIQLGCLVALDLGDQGLDLAAWRLPAAVFSAAGRSPSPMSSIRRANAYTAASARRFSAAAA
jgi:hypothetical protein